MRGRSEVRREHLGDAEIQQFGRSFRRHQDVAGLDVAMNHQLLMGILNRRTHRQKKLQPCADVQIALVAVAIERQPLNVLHHEVRLAVFGASSFQQAGDIRVVQIGEDLAFGDKALSRKSPIEPAPHHLDRDHLMKLIIGAHRPVYRAHPAVADLFSELIRAHPPA
jgi:hypothetical protein